MAETQSAAIEPDKTPYGYEVEKAGIPLMDAEMPAGNAMNPESFDVDVNQPMISETPVSEQQAESTQGSEQDPAKEDSSRFEYWQSQTDKVKGELSNAKQELEYYKGLTQQQQSTVSSGQPNGQPQQQVGVQEDSLKSPVKPTKPINYSEVDAYNDPESTSFAHRLEKERYQDDYMGYLEKKDKNREEEMRTQYEYALTQQQTAMVKSNAMSHAIGGYGFDQIKAGDFVNWASNPNNVTVDHLIKLYMMKDAPDARVEQKKQEMRKSQQVLSMPRSAAVETGISESPKSDEDLFNQGLLSLKR
jgi:hypothetical protein